MLTARILADHFDKVTILERDTLPDTPEVRSGVPQARHAHLFLARGLDIMEGLFPGIADDFKAAGATQINWGSTSRLFISTNEMPELETDLVSVSATRALLDDVVYRRLQQIDNIDYRESVRVTDIHYDPATERITGVTYQARRSRESHTCTADLIVDASGRSSQAGDWLESLGYPSPDKTIIDASVQYTSRIYKIPADFNESWKVTSRMALMPETRAATVQAVENNQWLVTLAGYQGDFAPTTDEGFLDYARSFPVCNIGSYLEKADPVTDPVGYGHTKNRWLHYEKLARQPRRFIVLGDAFCSFNPTYGQGMTTSAMGAQALDECLREIDSLDDLAPLFQQRLADVYTDPWELASGTDMQYILDAPEPGLFDRVSKAYFFAALRSVPHSKAVSRAFLQLLHMVAPPTVLFKPAVVVDVLRYGFRQTTPDDSTLETAADPV